MSTLLLYVFFGLDRLNDKLGIRVIVLVKMTKGQFPVALKRKQGFFEHQDLCQGNEFPFFRIIFHNGFLRLYSLIEINNIPNITINFRIMINPIKSICCTFVIISLITIVNSLQTLSALRYGFDSFINDVAIQYEVKPSPEKSSLYYAVFHPQTDFLKDGKIYSFCFLQQTIIQIESDSFNCQLTNNKTYYDCITIANNNGDSTNLSYEYWQMGLNNVIINQSSQYIPNQPYGIAQTARANILIGLKGAINQKQFNYISTPNTFYKVLTTDGKFFNQGNFKLNYLSTFPSSFNQEYKTNSRNLLVQRFPYCYLHKDDKSELSVYNVIFVGGVTRQGFPIYLMSFVHFEVKYKKFIMWEGLSFSSDKANRDMIGIRPINGVVQDLFCLFARAPWTDNSSNIGGAQNVVLLSSSSQITQNNVSWFYQTNIMRPYQTDDSVADEAIFFKLNNQYCYVYSFMISQTPNPQYSYLDNSDSNKHKAPLCFEPDLDIFEIMGQLKLFLMAMIIILIF